VGVFFLNQWNVGRSIMLNQRNHSLNNAAHYPKRPSLQIRTLAEDSREKGMAKSDQHLPKLIEKEEKEAPILVD
jgi:hypothetical protein